MSRDSIESLPRNDRFVFLAILGLMLLAAAYLFWPYVHDIILGLVFAALSRPFFQYTCKRFGGRKKLAAGTTVSLLAFVLLGIAIFLFVSLAREALVAYEALEAAFQEGTLEEMFFEKGFLAERTRDITKMLGIELRAHELVDKLSASAGEMARNVAYFVRSFFSNLASSVLHFVLTLVLTFGFLVEGHSLKSWFYRAVPISTEVKDHLALNFAEVSKATFLGNGLGGLLQGLLGTIGMVIFGLPSPIFWGAVMTIFAFLPLVGISVVAVPAGIYLFFVGRTWAAVIFLVLTLGGAIFLENIVKTRLISRYMHMHDLLIFFSILGGLNAFGILGLLYGPLILALTLTLVQTYTSSISRATLTPPKV